MEQPVPVCCATCGFLAKRTAPTPKASPEKNHPYDYAPPPKYVEVSIESRTSGEMGNAPGEHTRIQHAEPACVAQAHNLQDEIESEANGGSHKAVVAARLKAINKERDCERWINYQQGFSPKEHLLMDFIAKWEQNRKAWEKSLSEDMEAQRREWDMKMEKGRREWDEKMHVREAEENQKFSTITNKIGWYALAIAVVGLLIALASMTPDSVLGRLLMSQPASARSSQPQGLDTPHSPTPAAASERP